MCSGIRHGKEEGVVATNGLLRMPQSIMHDSSKAFAWPCVLPLSLYSNKYIDFFAKALQSSGM
jgi:hypothetical protein